MIHSRNFSVCRYIPAQLVFSWDWGAGFTFRAAQAVGKIFRDLCGRGRISAAIFTWTVEDKFRDLISLENLILEDLYTTNCIGISGNTAAFERDIQTHLVPTSGRYSIEGGHNLSQGMFRFLIFEIEL
jgi:hypothetical protein